MRTRAKIADLSLAQWDRVQTRLLTSYDIVPGTPTVCAVFELTPDFHERHAEMPVFEFAALLAELGQITERHTGEVGPEEVAQAALTPDALPDRLNEIRNAADPSRGPATMPVSYEDGDATYDGRA